MIMDVVVSSKLIDLVKTYCKSEYPNEACGVLIGRRFSNNEIQITKVLRAKNVSPTPRVTYDLDPLFVAQSHELAEQEGLEVVGFYHSHPNHSPNPSLTDLKFAWPDTVYLIVSLKQELVTKVKAWIRKEDKSGFNPLNLIIVD